MENTKSRRNPLLRKGEDYKFLLLALIVLPVLVAILYGSSLAAPFVFDDSSHILHNPTVTSFQGWFDSGSMHRLFNTKFGLQGRPLLFLTYALNYRASGTNPQPFRQVNLLVHAINSILVCLIVFELGGLDNFQKKHRVWLGLLAGAIFAAHPLATESVTYIAGRSASLVGTFYLAGLHLALRAGHAKSWRRYIFLALSVLSAVAGLLVKQDAMTLPVASIALIWLAWPSDMPSKQRWTDAAVLAFPLILVSSTQISSLGEVSALTQSNVALVAAGYEKTLPFVTYVLTSIKAYTAYYLWRLCLPVSLSIDPEVPAVSSILSPGFVGGLIVLLSLACCVLWFRSRRPLVAVGIALVLTSPLTGSCLFPLADVVAEHRAYLAILGSAVVLADILLRSRYAVCASLAVLFVYSWLTVERNKVWADEVQLWQDASRKAPDKLRPHINLGGLYQLRGETDRAIQEYEFVLRGHSDQSTALANLAALYTDRNDLGRAEALLKPAIDRNDEFPPIYVGMAVVRLRQSRFAEAQELLEHAYALDPTQTMVHHNLGDIRLQENQPSNAVTEYLAELQINPNSAITHWHLAIAYEALGLRDKSIEQYREVARMDPLNPHVQSALQRLR